MAATNYSKTGSVEIVTHEDPLRVSERVAVAAFLAGYSGGTRTSYTTDLRVLPAGAMIIISTSSP